MRVHTIRLTDGRDLKLEIEKFVKDNNIKAGFVISCVGSLGQAKLRMAGAQPDKQDVRKFSGDLEIVSLVGTLSINGMHLHMSVSNAEGIVVGGHLKEGCLVNTTVELVIGEDTSSVYTRVLDKHTGFNELKLENI